VALLTLIDWPEPFGLVMIEAMACGTPVIAFPRGAVPEIIEDGVNGFIVVDETEAVSAVGKLGQLARAGVRARFFERFTSRRMAEDYLHIYAKLVDVAPKRASTVRLTHLPPASLTSLAASSPGPSVQIS
jgi:glycosyltransferase involved in cell wall biosynthesis